MKELDKISNGLELLAEMLRTTPEVIDPAKVPELLESYAEKLKAVKAEYKNLHGSDYNPRAVGAQAFWTAD